MLDALPRTPAVRDARVSEVGKRDVVDHNAIRAFASVGIPVLLAAMAPLRRGGQNSLAQHRDLESTPAHAKVGI